MSIKTPILTVAFLFACLAFTATPALAVSEGPQWTVTSVSRPTNFTPPAAGKSSEDAYVVQVTNAGAERSNGEPITIRDELPAGLSLDPTGAYGEDELKTWEPTDPDATGPVKLTCLLDSLDLAASV